MKPLLLASAMVMLFAPVALAPTHALAQPFDVVIDRGDGVVYRVDRADLVYLTPPPGYEPYGARGYGSPNFHPPVYGAPLFGQPSFVPPRFAPPIPPGYDPERPSNSGWRRGQHLPLAFRGEIVGDYARYHLRRPPRGYCWYRDADDYILASVGGGLIFEVISGD